MFKLGELGVLSPQMEKLGLLGPNDKSKRRPGDVSFANWRYGRGIAIDVAVLCPLADSHVHQKEPCEVYAERQKHKRDLSDDFVAIWIQQEKKNASPEHLLAKQISCLRAY